MPDIIILHLLPILILQPDEISKSVTRTNGKDEAKEPSQTHVPRRDPCQDRVVSGYKLGSPNPGTVQLSHAVFPPELSVLISACRYPVRPSLLSKNVII